MPEKTPDMELKPIVPLGPLRFRVPGRKLDENDDGERVKITVSRKCAVKNDEDIRGDVKFFLAKVQKSFYCYLIKIYSELVKRNFLRCS